MHPLRVISRLGGSLQRSRWIGLRQAGLTLAARARRSHGEASPVVLIWVLICVSAQPRGGRAPS